MPSSGPRRWPSTASAGPQRTSIGDTAVRVVRPAGLVLLKLHAGGPRDAWDVRALLESLDGLDTIKAEVDRMVPLLPLESQSLWHRVREGR